MSYYVKHLESSWIYASSYTKVTSFSPPYSAVTRIYTPVVDGTRENTTGVVIAPGFILSAWHAFNEYPLSTKIIERASSTIGAAADSVGGESLVFLRYGSAFTSDLAVVKLDEEVTLDVDDMPGLYVSLGQANDDLLAEAYTVSHPMSLYDDASATTRSAFTQYELNVDARTQYSNTEGTWADWTKVGSGGHSGGPVFVTGTSGPEEGKAFVAGILTWANATGDSGANGNGDGVGGMLITLDEKLQIDDLLEGAGYEADDLPTDLIQGGGSADNVRGSFKNEIIHDGDGEDVVEGAAGTNHIALDADGDADMIVVGEGVDIISGGDEDDRLTFRTALLAQPTPFDDWRAETEEIEITHVGAGLAGPAFQTSGIPILGGFGSGDEGAPYGYFPATQEVFYVAMENMWHVRTDAEPYFPEYALSYAWHLIDNDDIPYVLHRNDMSFSVGYSYKDSFAGEAPEQLESVWADIDNDDLIIDIRTANDEVSYTILKDFAEGDYGIQFFDLAVDQMPFDVSAVMAYVDDEAGVDYINNNGEYYALPTRADRRDDGIDRTGGAGDDDLAGGGGADVLDGGAGNDTLRGAYGHDTLAGGAGNDLVRGSGGDDVLQGGDGNDELSDRLGDNTFEGGAGDDTASGGDGADSYIYAAGDGDDAIEDTSGSTEEHDVLALADLDAADVTLLRGGDDLYVAITASGEVITVIGQFASETENFGIDEIHFADETVWDRSAIASAAAVETHVQSITGTAGADTLTGDYGANTIEGLDGDDTILGRMAADLLLGGAGDDSINGGAGADLIQGGEDDDALSGWNGDDTFVVTVDDGDDSIAGGNGHDILDFLAFAVNSSTTVDLGAGSATGADIGTDSIAGVEEVWAGAGDDTLTGGAADETLLGGEGDDTLSGGGGKDILLGEQGSDTFAYDAGDGADQIADYGEDVGFDVLSFGAGITPGDVSFDWDPDSGDAIMLIGETGDRITITAQFSSWGGIEEIHFADATTWTAADLREWFTAAQETGGDDWISGTPYADTIDAGAGNDFVRSDEGDDSIEAGTGDDEIYGDGGDDTFVYDAGFGRDVIQDFTPGEATDDVIEFKDDIFGDFSAVIGAASQNGDDVVIEYDVGNTLTLAGIQLASLHQDDFRFIA
jgi:Ca2+-binding RTX toxin-like protein